LPAVTVDNIIARARSAADMRDNFVTPAEWLAWFNVERRWLDQFIARHGLVNAETSVSITTDGSTATYPLNDPLAILGVYELRSGFYREVKPSDTMGLAADHIAAPGVVVSPATKYRAFQGASGQVEITFYPTPAAGETYVVYEIAQAADVTDTTTSVTYPMNFEERIVLGLARRALAKEETTNGALERETQRIESHIEEVALDRAYGAFQRVRNVDRRERGWVRWPEIPTRERWQFF
jgi:hypothetical protein